MTYIDHYFTGDHPPRGFCDPPAKCPPKANDISGSEVESLFKTIDEKCLKFNVMKIKPTNEPMKTNHMVQQFQEIAAPFDGSQRFHVYDMNNRGLDFNTIGDSILDSIESQMKTTNEYLNNPQPAQYNRCIEL